jgi:hypothetical protein
VITGLGPIGSMGFTPDGCGNLAGRARERGSWAGAGHAGLGGEGRLAGPPAGFGPLG